MAAVPRARRGCRRAVGGAGALPPPPGSRAAWARPAGGAGRARQGVDRRRPAVGEGVEAAASAAASAAAAAQPELPPVEVPADTALSWAVSLGFGVAVVMLGGITVGVIYLSFTNFMDSRAEKKAVEAAELGGADFTTSPREAKGKLRPGETEDMWGRDGAKAPAKGSKALAVEKKLGKAKGFGGRE